MGTSERGTVTVDSSEFALPKYRHALVVFGGVQVGRAGVGLGWSVGFRGTPGVRFAKNRVVTYRFARSQQTPIVLFNIKSNNNQQQQPTQPDKGES